MSAIQNINLSFVCMQSKRHVQDLRSSSHKQKVITHPLLGADVATIIRLIQDNRPITRKAKRVLGLALGSSLARWPLMQLEFFLTKWKIKSLSMAAPIFIVGHWRSGTTHLANIMSNAPRYGIISPLASGLPWELLSIGKLFRPILEKSIPEDRLIDRVPVTPRSPQEDEFGIANMFPYSFLHGLYFPQKLHQYIQQGIFWEGLTEKEMECWKSLFITYLKKVYLYEGKRPLLIRNPVYTARIKTIRDLIPGAKFIHIYRNPYQVFVSMQNYYRKLLPALALQDYNNLEVDKVILNTYLNMMISFDQDSLKLGNNELIQIRYEDLDKEPLKVLESIYKQLNLKEYEKDIVYFQKYLDGIHHYRKNAYRYDEETLRMVQSHWGRYIDRWGYEIPIIK